MSERFQVQVDRFIPTEELQKLSEGSYEFLIARLSEAVQQRSSDLFGKDVRVRIVGTFPNSALAMSEDADLVRVHFSADRGGNVQILKHEKVAVPTYTPENIDQFLNKEAGKVVEDWMAGRVGEAKRRAANLASFVAPRASLTDEQIIESLLAELDSRRPWRVAYRSSSARIRKVVGAEVVATLEENRAKPKFRLLYEGGEEDLEKFRDLVSTDLSYLGEQVDSLGELIEAAYESARSVIESEDLHEEAITAFVAFSEDLVLDLNRLHEVLTESVRRIKSIDCLGKLHDAVAKRMHEYEVAGRFVTTMAQRLSEASKQENSE